MIITNHQQSKLLVAIKNKHYYLYNDCYQHQQTKLLVAINKNVTYTLSHNPCPIDLYKWKQLLGQIIRDIMYVYTYIHMYMYVNTYFIWYWISNICKVSFDIMAAHSTPVPQSHAQCLQACDVTGKLENSRQKNVKKKG